MSRYFFYDFLEREEIRGLVFSFLKFNLDKLVI